MKHMLFAARLGVIGLAAFYCAATVCVAQTGNGTDGVRLQGRILIEGSDEDVPYATITVADDSAQVISRQVSDGSGRFAFQVKRSRSYRLTVSAVGYVTTTEGISVAAGETVRNLGDILMKEGIELGEVSVTAQKPLIKSDPDKLIYSVEADPEAKSNTLLEIIRKVPLLSVDSEDNVTLNGQSNYKVLVNGKSSSLMSNNFKEVIKSMPAHTIKDIEVITSPSSRYEAEGVGGIINIITSRERTAGYTGSVGANATSRGGYGVNAYVAANIDKFSFSTNIYLNRSKQPPSENYSSRVNLMSDTYRYTDTKGETRSRSHSGNLNFEAGYEIDSLNLISASAWGYLGTGHFDRLATTAEQDIRNNPVRRYVNRMGGENTSGYLSGNVDYQRSFAKKDKTFTASYKMDYNPDNSKNSTDVDGQLNYISYRQMSDNRSSGQTHTLQLDYFDPLTENHQIETGLKGIYRRNFSETDISVFDSPTDSWQEDPSRLNDLDYDQYIIGIYAGYLFKHNKTSTKAGARAEYTWNDGLFKSQVNTPFNNTLFNLIPYINFTYALQPARTVKVSYTQRLYRPGIWVLNPYVNDLDPLNISYGNPQLDAEISHSFSASYGQFSPKFNLNIDLNSSVTNNSIEQYSFINENGVHHSTYGNIGSNRRYGANMFVSFRPNGNLNFYGNGRVNYVVLDSNNEMKRHNEGWMSGYSLGARWTAWKGGSLSANAGGSSPWIQLQGKGSAYRYTSIGVTQKLLKDKLDLSVYISDPFARKVYYRSDIDDPTYTMHSESFRWGQTARISLIYRFGKMNATVKKARRGISSDDQREGNSQGGSTEN
ncbi:MAG: TonB-dependent receptor [Tannerella sp.]|jgi:outer membrane cobalamin receptor|nr:TonB-dependent receptor [Tannerella sp.]